MIGFNQEGQEVMLFRRTLMVYKGGRGPAIRRFTASSEGR